MSLAAVIITKNEAKNIVMCLDSLHSFCDEIIVVDSYSTDNTIELASNYPKVKIFQREFDDYIAQKNYANALANSAYILSLDADEYGDASLKEFLRSEVYKDYDAVKFLRINFVAGQAVRNGIWRRDIKLRLWKKEKGYWTGTIPHEHLALQDAKNVLFSTARIHHHAYATWEEISNKSEKYAHLAAFHYKTKSYFHLSTSLLINPIFKFMKGYILLRGFRDGRLGLFIAIVSAKETFNKYFYALKLKFSNA